jgi:anti-sigma-K factor RskA
MKPSAYLDAAKAELNVTSDYELGKRLQCRPNHISEFRTEKRGMPIDTMYRIAITLKLDPAEVVADLTSQRETDPVKLEFWRSFMSRAAYGIAGVCCTLALIVSDTCANAAAVTGGSLDRIIKRLRKTEDFTMWSYFEKTKKIGA